MNSPVLFIHWIFILKFFDKLPVSLPRLSPTKQAHKPTLPKQKEMFAKMLDLNQLYANTSEMEDKKFGLSKEDIA